MPEAAGIARSIPVQPSVTEFDEQWSSIGRRLHIEHPKAYRRFMLAFEVLLEPSGEKIT